MGVRRNQRLLSKADKERFVKAVLEMKAKPAAAYNYDKYVTMHQAAFAGGTTDSNPAHNGPAFFPWHREFILRFEKDLQAADLALGKDGTITLPYWDWTRDNDPSDTKKAAGRLFHDDFMGPKGDPVAAGHFKAGSWTIVPAGDLIRAYGDSAIDANTVATLAARSEVKAGLEMHAFDAFPWDETVDAGTPVSSPHPPKVTAKAGGTMALGEYFVICTYRNAADPGNTTTGESLPSVSRKVCLGAGCTPANTHASIEITSPGPRAGATQYNVYVTAVGGAAGTETFQSGPTALGTDTTLTSVAVGRKRPTVNTTGSARNVIEGWASTRGEPEIHNRTHVWIGGTMSGSDSPNDPLFFLHHCNIDRLWALWQFRHPGQQYPEVVPNVVPPGNRPHGLNDAMPPWTTKPIDVLNHVALGYTYDTDPVGVTVNVSP
jgi:hypothetical protein